MIISGENTVVILKDSVGGGTFTSADTIARVEDGATLKIENGSYNCESNTAFWAGSKEKSGNIIVGTEAGGPTIESQEYALGFGKNSTLTVNNGTFTARDNAVLGGNGTAGFYDGANVVVNGGTFNGHIQSSGYTGCGVYMPQDGTLTINGGTFTVDGVGVCARAGEVNINGGNFISTVATEGWVGDRKTQVSPNGVFYDGAAKYPGLAEGAKLNITDGTFTNTADGTIPAVKVTQSDTIQVEVNAGDWSIAE